MNIGKFKLTPLEFGHFRLDGGAMFGVVPRVLWERFHPPDENNRIDMVMRGLLIEVDDRKILVDTGFGADRTEKFRKRFAFTGSDDHMDRALETAGLMRDQITDVIITHLHFDHTGGATINKNKHPEPTFPNAHYYIQKRQLGHARSGLERDRASYLAVDFKPLIDSDVVEIVDGHWSLLDGFDCLVVNGHTPAMQLPRIVGGNDTLIYAADLIPLASQLSLPWIMAYDLYPVTTLQEKKEILAQAAVRNWTFFFEHDPRHTFGKVKRTDKGFALAD